jgi:hypothetical protein
LKAVIFDNFIKMKFIFIDWIFYLLLFCLFTKFCLAKQWTEDDEKRRIAKIKEDELRQFKAEMGSGRSGFGTDSLYGEADISKGAGVVDYSGEVAYPKYRASPQQYCQLLLLSVFFLHFIQK